MSHFGLKKREISMTLQFAQDHVMSCSRMLRFMGSETGRYRWIRASAGMTDLVIYRQNE